SPWFFLLVLFLFTSPPPPPPHYFIIDPLLKILKKLLKQMPLYEFYLQNRKFGSLIQQVTGKFILI
ncbi:MAG: hypothetical protein FWD28_10760, partial [Treponema sp.]|nr:hypothetical protein [Treponema sp.]